MTILSCKGILVVNILNVHIPALNKFRHTVYTKKRMIIYFEVISKVFARIMFSHRVYQL